MYFDHGHDGIPDDVLVYLYSGIPFLLRRADQRAASLFKEALGSGDVTLTQMQLLFVLGRLGTMSQAEVGRITAIDSSTASLVINTIAKRGWIRRTGSPSDRRCKMLSATPAGEGVVEVALPAFGSAIEKFQSPLSGEATRLLLLLSKIVDHHDRAAGRHIPLHAPLGIIHQSAHFLIRRCIQISEAAVAANVGTNALTMRQYAVLLIVALDGGIGEAAISRALGYELSNTSFVLRLLTGKVLVRCNLVGRRRTYRITDEGRSLLRAVERPLSRAIETLLTSLDDDERRELRCLLGRVVLADGDSGPPAFARIVQRSDWPMATRSNFYLRHIGPEIEADPEDADIELGPLLSCAAKQLEQGYRPSHFLRSDREELKRLLLKLLLPGAQGKK